MKKNQTSPRSHAPKFCIVGKSPQKMVAIALTALKGSTPGFALVPCSSGIGYLSDWQELTGD
jgi:hypothetical protein